MSLISSSGRKINQSGATAGQDVVAGDKNTTNYFYETPLPVTKIAMLQQKLFEEISNNAEVQNKIEQLQRYFEKKSHDGIDGLEAKLKAGHRESELFFALEKKEEFAKLIDRWSMYLSAQEMFVVMLAKVEYEFNLFVMPKIGVVGECDVNQIVHDRIVEPTVAQCATGVIDINHGVVMGMVYWLAEQCFVRWHK
jgi:hypothetical protein